MESTLTRLSVPQHWTKKRASKAFEGAKPIVVLWIRDLPDKTLLNSRERLMKGILLQGRTVHTVKLQSLS
jgi:hypothetical protein